MHSTSDKYITYLREIKEKARKKKFELLDLTIKEGTKNQEDIYNKYKELAEKYSLYEFFVVQLREGKHKPAQLDTDKLLEELNEVVNTSNEDCTFIPSSFVGDEDVNKGILKINKCSYFIAIVYDKKNTFTGKQVANCLEQNNKDFEFIYNPSKLYKKIYKTKILTEAEVNKNKIDVSCLDQPLIHSTIGIENYQVDNCNLYFKKKNDFNIPYYKVISFLRFIPYIISVMLL